MEKIKRNSCILDNSSPITDLYTFKNFPVNMGCTDQDREKDLFADMVWGYSANGIVQLKELLPLEVLYSDSHSPGTTGKTWQLHHENFSKFIEKDIDSKNILEIGGASGLLVDNFLKTDKKFKWDIVEPSDQTFKDNRITHYKILFEDFKKNLKYDAVIHSHLFEHVYNPIHFLLKINKVLKLEGFQYVSLPNMPHWLNNGYSNSLNFEHTFYYDKNILEHLFSKTGFEIIDYKTDDHSLFFKTKKIKETETVDKRGLEIMVNSKDMFKSYIGNLEETVNKIKKMSSTVDKLYLFGAHIFSQKLLNMGLQESLVSGILDNNKNKQGKRLYGTNQIVYEPEIISKEKNVCVVVKAGAYTSEIIDQINIINDKVKIIS